MEKQNDATYESVVTPLKWVILGIILTIIVILSLIIYSVKSIGRAMAFTPACTPGMCGIPGYTRQRSVLQNMLEMTPLTWNDSH